MLRVEVAYALFERQFLKSLDVKPGASVSEAITLSGVLEEFPEINLNINPVGIYSKKVTLDSIAFSWLSIDEPLWGSPEALDRSQYDHRF